MSDNAKVPVIRLKDFTSLWEQRKLCEISSKVTEKNTSMTYLETFTNSAEFGVVSQRDFFDHDISNSENLNGYYVVKMEDFVYNPRISTFAPVGPVNRNKLGRNGVMSPLYTVFRTRDIDNAFLEQYFKSGYWHKFMKLNGDSGARADRFSIKDSIFVEMPIPYPALQEQKKIGIYLTHLDKLITLHQHKLDKLKNLKKAMLDKMFPREGSKVPEIRFAGFTNVWEQHKLSDLGEIITGTTPKTNDPTNYGGIFLFVSPADIQGNRYVEKTITTLSKKGFNSGRQIREGASLFVSIGSTIGKVAQTVQKSTSNQQINSLIPNKRYDDDFVFTSLEKQSARIKAIASNQAVPIVNKTTFGETEVMIPNSKNEQVLIGKYFQSLDNLITLHHSKIEKLENIKKAFLEKMFV